MPRGARSHSNQTWLLDNSITNQSGTDGSQQAYQITQLPMHELASPAGARIDCLEIEFE